MADRKQLFGDLLRYVEGGDANRPISIFIEGATWDFEARDLKDILLMALYEVPNLQKSLDLAAKDIKTLQEQMDTAALKRTLHHLYEQVEDETLEAKPPRWEYRFLESIYKATNERLETQLNEMGRDGWELVNIEFKHGSAIFKRPI